MTSRHYANRMPLLSLALAFLLARACLAAPAWHPADITYSDGTRHACELQAMGDGTLTLKVSSVGRSLPRRVAMEDILEIRQEVEEAQQNRPWMYAESGKNERIDLAEESYPFLNFGTALLLTNGELVRGHLISAAFRCRDNLGGNSSKLFITRQLKGKPGQTAADLRFPLVIRLTANAPQAAKAITGALPEATFGRLQRVVAIDLRRGIIVEAALEGNSFAFPPLLDGKYELYAQTARFLLAGFPDGGAAVPEELGQAFRLADDFFGDRTILGRDGTRTLVWKQRRHFYHDEEHLDGGILRHLEVWQWHQAGAEWKLDSRLIPFRLKQQGGEADRPLLLMPDFSAVEPGAAVKPAAAGKPLPYPAPRSE